MESVAATSIARELLLEGAGACGTVEFHGDSMLPLLRDGDALAVEPVAWEEIQPGDIVVYRLEERYPALRVVEKLADKLFLLADNWRAPVFEAWRGDVLGRVAGLRRGALELSRQSAAWRRASTRALLEYRLRRAVGAVRDRTHVLARRLRADAVALGSGMAGLPEALQVNVSSVCNLKCRMCPYLGVHRDDSYLNFMSPETLESLLPAIRKAGAVLFSGSGEPLYNRHLLSFIGRVRAECPAARISLTTNATLLRQEVAEELIRLRLDTITISIDGATAQTVEGIRRNSDFERIAANVERLARIRRELGSRVPRIQANYMLGYGTYRELPEFVRLAQRLGIEDVHLLEIQPSCHGDTGDDLAENLRRDGGRRLRLAIQLGHHLGVALHMPAVTPGACLFPYHPHVAENGEVYPCCFLDYEGRTLWDGEREVTAPPLSFGNAAARGFRAVWNSRDYLSFRRRNKTGDFPEFCRSCFAIRESTAVAVARLVGRRPRQFGR